MMKRLALVGYGKIAPKHLEAFRAAGAQVVAVCNRSEIGRQRAVTEAGIAASFGSIAEMMGAIEIDGVICCASFTTMKDVVAELLPHQRPVLVEKPPGLSVAELDQLIGQQQQLGTPVMVALNRRFYDVVHQVKQRLVGSDAVHVNVEWSEDPAAFAARGFTPTQVAKLHQANSLHGLDLMVHLGGALHEVSVTRSASGRTATLSGRNDSGGVSSFMTSWELPLRWRVHAMSGHSRYLFAPLEQCLMTERNVDTKLTVDDDDVRYKAGFLRQAHAFLALIDSRASNHEATLSSVRPAMMLADQLEHAFAAGSP